MNLFLTVARWATLIAVSLACVACNTTRGAGKDLEDAGSGIKHSAERHGAD